MEGTDINFPDPDGLTNDHTYYGNGCPNGWRDNDPPLYGGSTISCSTNIVNTYDNKESQKIGAYYNFQAGTVGAGASITTENTNTLDTFCPLGWQLPYGGTGGDYYDQSKSFRYLTNIYGLITNSDGYKLALYPFDYIKSGYMNIGTQATRLYSITKFGAFNTRTNRTPTTYFTFSMNDISITLDSQNGKNSGHAIRFDCRISSLKNSTWHPRSLISIMAFHFLKAHFPSVKIMSNYLKNETKYFIFMELRANFDEAESKYKMENRILMSE